MNTKGGYSRKISCIVLTSLMGVFGCGNLKYVALKGTELPNPPTERVRVYVKQFPVTSKANVIDPNAMSGGDQYQGGGSSTNSLADVGNAIMVISRSTRIEDLTRSLLRELRSSELRFLSEYERVKDLTKVRSMSNPFELVAPEDKRAQLEISGEVILMSQRVEQRFSQNSSSVEVRIKIKDLSTGRETDILPVKAGIHMTFNSKELEEAIAVFISTVLTQKTLF
jgi:hypothetical protein